MATYYHGNSEIQGADGLQTLVLMNPGYVQYSDASASQQPGNFVFLNSASNSLNQASLTHAPPVQTQQFVGFPLAPHQDPNPQSMQAQAHHEISGMHGFGPRLQYNLWTSIDPSAAARDTPRAQQGLSLSLSSQQPGFGSQPQAAAVSGEDMRIAGSSPSSASGVTNGMQSVLMSSKYLKAAQELLDEVVNVGNCGIKVDPSKKNGNKSAGESSATAAASGDAAGEAGGKSAADLSTVERQEIQMKKVKLISMLDEVEQRYRQYHHQMQIVTSSFEQVAGIGSAKAYTSLALETISKQFRCLKDAIAGQIRGANKSLGEEDCVGGKIEGSRLKFVDHHLRQQRALQQLGMVQHNAWRPQRGLPERSVSVLRAWLFEHFLHPYPKDSDKHMLAKQACLTRSQVSNWFINARVRLWKPMVEEMYMEELKEQEQNGSEDKTMSKGGETNKEDSASMSQSKSPKRLMMNTNQDNSITNHDTASMATTPSLASPMAAPNVRNQSVFTLIGASELEEITQSSPKKPRSIDMLQSPTSNGASQNNMISMKFGGNERQARDHEYSQSANFIGGFGQYPIGEIGRFDTEQQQQQYTPRFSGNGVSLTLGLPHCENLSLSGTHQSFLQSQNMNQLGRRMDHLGEPNEFDHVMGASTPHSSSAYESINIQNRKSFAAQLLPDFVA